MRLVSLVAFACVALVAHADESFPSPFGLTWGMSVASLKELGFAEVNDSGGLKILSSVSAPKAWSKAEIYVAVTYKDRLVKAAANSFDFTDDVYGSEGKDNYNQIKSLLTKKYGEPTTHYERIGTTLYDDPDEFYQCLEYTGCGAYLSLFELSGGTIAVQLKGKRRGVGYLSIAYESPQFSVAKDEIERSDRNSDADAL